VSNRWGLSACCGQHGAKARLENLRHYSLSLNNGKGTALHWFASENDYANPTRFFEPIWKIGRTDDEGLHGLLESKDQ
jgi:hypothetical protein